MIYVLATTKSIKAFLIQKYLFKFINMLYKFFLIINILETKAGNLIKLK